MEIVVFMASWFTPTTLFLFLNLMIGTIVISSRFGSGPRNHPPEGLGSYHAPAPLARAPSFIDRVKSINLHLYKFPSRETDFFTDHHGVSGLDHNPAPLTRAPSLLDRVKSINLSYFKFPQYDHDNGYAHMNQPDVDPTRIDGVNSAGAPQFEIPEYPHRGPVNPTRLARAPSLLERVKSINFSSFYRSEPTHPETQPDQDPGPNPNPVPVRAAADEHRPKGGKSDAAKRNGKKASEKMKKSASEKSGNKGHVGGSGGGGGEVEETAEVVERRRPETARFERSTSFDDGEQSVDAKAADFINRFKQQLKLQRLDSILRYKEMLKAN